MIINRSGIVIRLAVQDLRVMGRATQGVKLINLRGEDAIAAVTKVDIMDDEDEEMENNENEGENQEPGDSTDNNGKVFE
jgi:DNA gyrase subunit A